VTRQVAQIKAQLASAQAGLRQAQENYALTVRQNNLAIRRAQASLAESRARLVQAAAPTRSQEVEQQTAAVRHAQASLARAEAQVVDAKRSLARQTALVGKGFVAQSAADSAQTSLALAEADRASAETDLASAKERLSLLNEGARKEDVDTARAAVDTARVSLDSERVNAANAQLRFRDVERARADVAQIENQLAQQSVALHDTRIIAPMSGEIVGKYLNEGELVASATAGFAQGAALVKIADLSKMQVMVNINEVDVTRLRLGMPVEIRVDGVKGEVFRGQVAAVAPSSLGSNTTTGQSSGQGAVVRFEVKVEVTTPDRRLRPGMTAAVDIVQARKQGVLILATEALQPGDQVTVVTKEGEKQVKTKRPVTVGLRNDAVIEVVSGLKEGDVVEVPKVEAKDRRKINFDGPNN
jgi:HlyD family secretion protein